MAYEPGRSPSRAERRDGRWMVSLIVCFLFPLPTPRLLVVLHVPAERARRGELAELVTDHRIRDEHRDVLATVMHRDRVTDHVGADHRPSRPGLDGVLRALLVLSLDLLGEVIIDEGALLQAAWHFSVAPISASCRTCGDG